MTEDLVVNEEDRVACPVCGSFDLTMQDGRIECNECGVILVETEQLIWQEA